MCVCVSVSLNVTPPRRWHSCKTSSKMPLSTSHQRHRALRLSGFSLWAELRFSHHHQVHDAHLSQRVNQPKRFSLIPFFFFLRETHWQRAKKKTQKTGIPNQQTYMRSLCPPNWFQLFLPHHWHCNKWAVFYQSWDVQTCEFNQVHRRLWLETHAAFLSYDLITRLFSSRVKGVGLTRLYIVLSYTFSFFFFLFFCGRRKKVLSVAWCGSSDSGPGMSFCGADGEADRFLMQLMPVRTSPWELLINQIIAVSKWRLGVGGWLPDVKRVALAEFGKWKKRVLASEIVEIGGC